GILLSLYYTSRGVVGVLKAFEKAYPSFYRRKFVRKTLVSFKVSFLLIILVMASIGVIVFGQWILPLALNYFETTSRMTLYALVVLRWVALVALLYIGFSLIYYYGPAIRQRWSFFTPGSLLAATLSLVASLLFSLMVNNFGQLNKLYGSIGTLIIVMLWIYWNAMILLVGFELNAAIELNRLAKLEKGRDALDDDDD
ncbi:MAG TPA: YihY/virulence factor BrkB family protein, partial [Chitinophagales bacterium]|nr:YihY/virulence factor BrkB family protein [Chitinophagales bacterium]